MDNNRICVLHVYITINRKYISCMMLKPYNTNYRNNEVCHYINWILDCIANIDSIDRKMYIGCHLWMLIILIQSFTIFVNESLLMFDYPEFHNSFGELLRKGNISSSQGTSQSLLRIPGIRTKNKMKTHFHG